MPTVYKITDLIDGRSYIGRCSRSLGQRVAAYRCQARDERWRSPIYQAMREHGFEMFRFSVLAEHDEYESICGEERRLIAALKPDLNARAGHRYSGKTVTPRYRPQPALPHDWARPGERWRQVVGFEGRYEVSNIGRARSVPGRSAGRPGAPHYGFPGKILRASKNVHKVVLYAGDGTHRIIGVHVLVLEAFVCQRPNGLWALHKDDNRRNNTVGNLYWGTPKENTKDAYANGKMAVGESHHAAKLTREQVVEIHALRGKLSIAAIAKMFGVEKLCVGDIHRGVTWSEVFNGQSAIASLSYVMKGEAHYKARLSIEDVIAIREARCSGETYKSIGKRFGVSKDTIYAIATRRIWKSVP